MPRLLNVVDSVDDVRRRLVGGDACIYRYLHRDVALGLVDDDHS